MSGSEENRSSPPLPQSNAELAKQPENYKSRPELSMNDYEKKPVVAKKKQNFVSSTSKQIKGKLSDDDPLKAKN